MWSTPSLPLLPSLQWSGVVAPNRTLSIRQIELLVVGTVQTNDLCGIELLEILLFHHKLCVNKSLTNWIVSNTGWQKKNRTHVFLTEIHEFNSSLFFFSGYEVDSVHEKLGQ